MQVYDEAFRKNVETHDMTNDASVSRPLGKPNAEGIQS